MLTESEILEIIEKGENSSVEFKTSDVRSESLAREIVGFANTQGGLILIGVSDNKDIIGIDSNRKFAEFLANVSRNNIIPPIDCIYSEFQLDDKLICLVEVPKGIDKPYQTIDGKYLIRVNSTLRTASQGELLRLFQQTGMFHFDLTGVKNTGENDLNLYAVDKYFEKYGFKFSEITESERLHLLKNSDILTEDGELTIAGMLIFGINPQKHLPQSGISFARFSGNEMTSELLDKKEIGGNLDFVVDTCTSLITSYIPVPSDIIGNVRVNTQKSWSVRSFREVISNACIHRNYSIYGSKIRVFMYGNRIEIISPGRLPNTVNIEKLKVGVSFSINPVIVKFMENMGYVDKLGRGIPLVYRESLEIGKKLDLKEIGDEFKVTLEL